MNLIGLQQSLIRNVDLSGLIKSQFPYSSTSWAIKGVSFIGLTSFIYLNKFTENQLIETAKGVALGIFGAAIIADSYIKANQFEAVSSKWKKGPKIKIKGYTRFEFIKILFGALVLGQGVYIGISNYSSQLTDAFKYQNNLNGKCTNLIKNGIPVNHSELLEEQCTLDVLYHFHVTKLISDQYEDKLGTDALRKCGVIISNEFPIIFPIAPYIVKDTITKVTAFSNVSFTNSTHHPCDYSPVSSSFVKWNSFTIKNPNHTALDYWLQKRDDLEYRLTHRMPSSDKDFKLIELYSNAMHFIKENLPLFKYRGAKMLKSVNYRLQKS